MLRLTFRSDRTRLQVALYEDRREQCDGQLALVRIVTRAASFPQVLEALTERYGPPLVSQTDTLRDRMEGWLPGASYRWERAAGAIMATEYSTSFEDSEIQYRLRAWEDANLAARRRRLLANAQDM